MGGGGGGGLFCLYEKNAFVFGCLPGYLLVLWSVSVMICCAWLLLLDCALLWYCVWWGKGVLGGLYCVAVWLWSILLPLLFAVVLMGLCALWYVLCIGVSVFLWVVCFVWWCFVWVGWGKWG